MMSQHYYRIAVYLINYCCFKTPS